MPLHRIGYWKATLSDPLPLPQELEVELDPLLRDRIASYLEAGEVVERYLGFSWCRCGCQEPNGSRELSDGTWVWPEGLAHYVRQHRIGLPPEVLRHIAHPIFAALRGKARRFFQDRNVHQDRWLTWSMSLRTDAFRQQLREATARADKAWEEVLQATAANLAAERGVGDKRCLKVGCSSPAIGGLELCGRCCAEQLHSHSSVHPPRSRFEGGELHRLLTTAFGVSLPPAGPPIEGIPL